jgi:hypothetical protein
VFTVPDRSAVEHAGADGVLGGVAGVVAPVVGEALEAAWDAVETAADAWLPAELLLLVDPQAAARAPVHSRAAPALIRRAAWADGLMCGSLVWRGCRLAGPAWRASSRAPGVS